MPFRPVLGTRPSEVTPGGFLLVTEPFELLSSNPLSLDHHGTGLVVGLALVLLLHDLGDQLEDVLGAGNDEGRPVSLYLFQE